MTETKQLTIEGMMCDACAGHVARALTGLDGVQTAMVDLAGASATVTYDPAAVTLGQMRDAVEDEGYRALE